MSPVGVTQRPQRRSGLIDASPGQITIRPERLERSMGGASSSDGWRGVGGDGALKKTMGTECKCHGVSGSCTMRTCWVTLPRFRQLGNRLMEKYKRAKRVVSLKGRRARKPIFLKLRRSKRPYKKPRRSDLVFLEESPNYCQRDPATGSMGTHNRRCNRTSKGLSNCNLLCCGRGYNTHQYIKTWQCNLCEEGSCTLINRRIKYNYTRRPCDAQDHVICWSCDAQDHMICGPCDARDYALP
ncbi:Protein Wnt-7b [Lamellibrachia satsuma]|nr:Protein Wnt-7b [Lamellibrachia satsuma]